MKISPGRRIKWIKRLGAVVALFCLGWWLCVEVIIPRGALNRRLHQAMSIGVACKLYASDHEGNYPDHLQDLVPDYVNDARVLSFRSIDDQRELESKYFGGSERSAPDVPLLRVGPEKPGGAVVVVYAGLYGAVRKASEAR